jgi:adenylate kinase
MLTEFSAQIDVVLGLEVDENELVKRLLLRGKTSGRADDQSEDTIRTRFQEYQNKTLPIQDFYTKQNKYIGIHGLGEIDQIFGQLCEKVDAINA